MNKIKMLAGASVTGVILASAVVSPALAWHPKGTIIKYVQNTTAGSALADANDAGSAVTAKPGDVLNYVIKVSNTGASASNGNNDMAHTTLTDNLPAGVELVSTPTQRAISVDLGTIKPGQTVAKEYAVKVTATEDGAVITNKACFTGNSLANDNPQSGCDVAVVKVHVPETPTPTPQTPSPTTPAQPTELPNTGAGNFVLPAVIVSGLGYVGYLLRLKRQHRTA